MTFENLDSENMQLYFQQIGLGVKRSFFEYFYTEEMNEEEKRLVDEKVKLAIEFLKTRLRRGYKEYCNIYDENYQFIIGVRLGLEATGQYYKFKKLIKELINFYTLEELQEIVKLGNYDAILGMQMLTRRSFFSYFYTDNMTEEEKMEINEKIILAIEHEKIYSALGYTIFCGIYDEKKYARIGIRIIDEEERNQLEQFINRISSLITPYSLKELQEMCEDEGIDIKKLQWKNKE